MANVVSRQRRFASDHADFAHKGVGVSNDGMLPEPQEFGKSQRWTEFGSFMTNDERFLANIRA